MGAHVPNRHGKGTPEGGRFAPDEKPAASDVADMLTLDSPTDAENDGGGGGLVDPVADLYDKMMYDADGYDGQGYNRSGFHTRGFSATNRHRNGTEYDDDGYDRLGFDSGGYLRDGFNTDGSHRNGTRFNDDGYNWDGFDKDGYLRDGFAPQWHPFQGRRRRGGG